MTTPHRSGAVRETPAAGRADEVRRLVPVLALGVAFVAAVTDPMSVSDAILIAIPVAAFALWAYTPHVPLVVLAFAVLVPAVLVQRSGAHEPAMFEASVLAFVVALWSSSLPASIALGLLAVASPVVVGLIESQGNISVGIWILGIAFPWVIGHAILRQGRLTAQLEATRRELADQALFEERRRIARDVHDFVGHGLAAVMIQVTSARHVLRRDPAAAEEALRSAEDVGRRSMQELRRTVALLRNDDQPGVLPPVPTASDIPALVDQAATAGFQVELRLRGDLGDVPPNVGLALYRITQEALANAARHAPRARTVVSFDLSDRHASLIAETIGPIPPASDDDEDRSGFGLVGMRERASALEGEFGAGPTPEGWRVSCRLPFERPADTAEPAADPTGRTARATHSST